MGVKVPMFHTEVPGYPTLLLMRPQEAEEMAQIIGSLPPTWETCTGVPAPSFSLGPRTMVGISGREPKDGNLLSASQRIILLNDL